MQLYATLIGAFLFSCLCTSVIWYVFIRDKLPLEHVDVNKVEIVELSSSSEPFVETIVEKGKPVVIHNSVITKWPALKKWNPQYLTEKEKDISGVYENVNKWFGPYYDRSKPMAEFSKRVNNYKTNVSLSTQQFIDRISNPTLGKYTYYTGDIDQFGDWAIHDITPYSELLKPNPAHSSINVWIGQSAVVAHCHYDGYHNFYAQLYGRKKFLLFSPTSFTGLYPYPFLHPSHAQAQVNLSEYEHIESFPLVKTVSAFEAILAPGDLLYIPPLWFHHVEALDVSMSVNIWTDTSQSDIMNEVFSTSLPIDEVEWHGEHLKAIGSSVILYRLVKAVCETMKCSRPDDSDSVKTKDRYLMERLWTSRYKMLMEKNVLSNTFSSVRNPHRKSLLCEQDFLPDLFYKGIAQKIDSSSISKYLVSIPKLISRLPMDTWETWFGNYVEFIAYKAVPLKDIGMFLKNYHTCIQFF